MHMRDRVRITRVDYDAEKEYGITRECDTEMILELLRSNGRKRYVSVVCT